MLNKELPHELFWTTRQENKKRNAVAKNMLTDKKLNKPQFSKIIKSGELLNKTLSNIISNIHKTHHYT